MANTALSFLETTNPEVSKILFDALRLRGGSGIGLVVPYIQPVLVSNERADPIPVTYPTYSRKQTPFWVSYTNTNNAGPVVSNKSSLCPIDSVDWLIPTGYRVLLTDISYENADGAAAKAGAVYDATAQNEGTIVEVLNTPLSSGRQKLFTLPKILVEGEHISILCQGTAAGVCRLFVTGLIEQV